MEPTLQTATQSMDRLADAVAYQLSKPVLGEGRLARGAFSRRRAGGAARVIVPMVVGGIPQYDTELRTGRPVPCPEYSKDLMVSAIEYQVRRSLTFWQLILWRVLIAIIVRMVVEWWFSENGENMRGIAK